MINRTGINEIDLTGRSGHKLCTQCGEERSLTEFHRDRRSRDGRQAQCAPCQLDRHRKAYQSNPETYKVRARAAYERSDKAQWGRRSAQWAKENPDKRRSIARRHHEKYIERKTAYRKAYYRKYPERAAYHYSVRRARIRGQMCSHQECPDAVRTMYAIRPKGIEVDHIIAIAKGGLHCIYNLQFLPAEINRRKGCS